VVRGAWVGEGFGDHPAGPGQSPDRGPRGPSPPEALGVWGITDIWGFFSFRNFFSDNTRIRILICFQNLTLGYMTNTLNQICFFSSTKIRIFFSATLGIRIFFQKKTITCKLTGPSLTTGGKGSLFVKEQILFLLKIILYNCYIYVFINTKFVLCCPIMSLCVRRFRVVMSVTISSWKRCSVRLFTSIC
jgi:hypothetical protein